MDTVVCLDRGAADVLGALTAVVLGVDPHTVASGLCEPLQVLAYLAHNNPVGGIGLVAPIPGRRS